MVIFKSPYPPVEIPKEPFGELVMAKLWTHAVEMPHKKALIKAEDGAVGITYADLYLNSLSVSAFLENRHFGHGDIACIVLPNCFEWVPIFLGCAMQGGAVSGASIVFTDYELQRQFVDSKSKIVFCSNNSLERVLKAAKTSPRISTIVVVETSPNPPENYPFGVIKFSDVVKTPPARGIPPKDIDVNRDILLLPYSSGTTGSPKGVMVTNTGFGTILNINLGHINSNILREYNFDFKNQHSILLLPFYHIYGFGCLCQGLVSGLTGIVMSHFDPEVFFRCIQEYKVKFMMTVPPILVALAKHPVRTKYDLSSLEVIVSGAAPAGKDLCDEVMTKNPSIKHILQGYGMTETSMTSHLPDLSDYKFGSVGKTQALTETKIVDVESGKELRSNQKGEIWVRGPTIMLGYLNKPTATAECVDDDGWLHTGDIGYVDEDGHLFIVDRLKELIKVKGLQVPPAELEDLLLSHPQVADAAVIGIPNSDFGEVPKAFIVRITDKLTEHQVQEFVRERVAHYKQLRGGVEFVKEIPKSAAGKILRRFLRDKEAGKHQQLSKI